MFCINTEEREIQHYTISLKKYDPAKSIFDLDDKENIIVFGFVSNSRRNDLKGVYFQKIDPRIQKFKFPVVSKTIYQAFTKDQEAEFKSKRGMKTEGNSYSFYPVEIGFFNNGDIMLISEQKYIYKKSYVNPKDKQEVYINQFFHKDLYLALGDENGKINWVKRVYKDQSGIENRGYYSSISTFNEGNNMRIFYNEHKSNFKDKPADKVKQLKNVEGKNPKGVPAMLTIFNDGLPMKDKLFTGEYKKQVLIPRSIAKNDGRYYYCTQSKDSYRYGMIYFE